jgi:8-oxo-dGTP diphosphatase
LTLTVVAAVITEGDRFLITRRQAGTHLAGLWEFPGGKAAAGETHAEALTRELREELAVDAAIGRLILQTRHAYAEREIVLFFYECTLAGAPTAVLGQEMRWAERHELTSLEFPPADAELITLLTSAASH